MTELHIIDKPITKEELKKIAEERFGDLEERELIKWVEYQFRFYREKEITREQLKEILTLGIEHIIR